MTKFKLRNMLDSFIYALDPPAQVKSDSLLNAAASFYITESNLNRPGEGLFFTLE